MPPVPRMAGTRTTALRGEPGGRGWWEKVISSESAQRDDQRVLKVAQTDRLLSAAALSSRDQLRKELHLLITNPEKKALIQPIISVCGIIIAMFPFIIPIMPSMAAGSDIGFGLGLPLDSGSARNLPS